jgi:glycosyltransferase involved in cell wall biosynthesis
MESDQKKKILWISDHPLVPSGVGTQSKYVIENILELGKYKFLCFGGAIQHPDYRPQKIAPEKYGDDGWIVFPVNGYGDKNLLRQVLLTERPDAVVIFTDPRFFTWIWEMEDELRSVCPLIYWHVWDNDPIPDFNKSYYESTDFISALSLKTYGLLQGLPHPRDRFNYIPHTVPPELFKPLPENEISDFKKVHLGPHSSREFILFWNNRNARRKQTGDVVACFSKFVDLIGHGRASLMMHTNVSDPEGQDVLAVARKFGVAEDLIVSQERLSPEDLNRIYNMVDCTINISSNEGFGLGTLESISAGTPIIVHMTGGLQFQIGDWWEGLRNFSDQDCLTKIAKDRWKSGLGRWCGIPVFSGTRSCTGGQQIPYIYDDKVNHDDVVKALRIIYGMGREKRKELGAKAREWCLQNFSFSKMISEWDLVLDTQIKVFKEKVHNNVRTQTL